MMETGLMTGLFEFPYGKLPLSLTSLRRRVFTLSDNSGQFLRVNDTLPSNMSDQAARRVGPRTV